MIPSTELYLQEAERILSANGEKSKCVIESVSNSGFEVYFLYFEEISSTMLLSEKWNRDLVTPTQAFVFIADSQTKGRGQKSNTWASPPGNVYMTMLANQKKSIISSMYYTITTLIAENVESALEVKEKVVHLKWVNDILLNNLKVGGILILTDIIGQEVSIQVGIGINAYEPNVQGSTGIAKHYPNINLGKQWKDKLIKKLSISILNTWKAIESTKTERLVQYNERLMYKGCMVNIFDVEMKSILKTGRFVETNQYGFAILEDQNGVKFEVSNGYMRLSD